MEIPYGGGERLSAAGRKYGHLTEYLLRHTLYSHHLSLRCKKEFASPSTLVVTICVTADGSEERLFELTIKRRRAFLFWLARAVQMSVWSPRLKPLTQTKDLAFNCCALFFVKKYFSAQRETLIVKVSSRRERLIPIYVMMLMTITGSKKDFIVQAGLLLQSEILMSGLKVISVNHIQRCM